MELFLKSKIIFKNYFREKSLFGIIFLLVFISQVIQAQPVFSHKHGFYDTPFSLSITPVKSGSDIYFTTDGSVPCAANGILYTTPLYIDMLTVIRAVEINNGQSGKTATCTFLFTDDIINQPNDPEGYPSMWGKYTGISGTAIADYEMDPELIAIPGLADSV
jgi:hypothetical protein